MNPKELIELVKQCVDINDQETLKELARQLKVTVEQLKNMAGVRK